MCGTKENAEAARTKAEEILSGLKLKMHPEKTRLVDLRMGRESFVFLGCTLRKVRSRKNGRLFFLNRWPSPRSMARIRERVRQVWDPRRNSGRRLVTVIRELRPVLLGWAAYSRTGNASRAFAEIERHALVRLRRLPHRRSQRDRGRSTSTEAATLGLPCLQGPIRYPGGANAAAV